jgi:hypothetical protein
MRQQLDASDQTVVAEVGGVGSFVAGEPMDGLRRDGRRASTSLPWINHNRSAPAL